MKVLITGANGFLGQHLCNFLKNRHQVIATGKGEKRLPFDEVEYFTMDITVGSNVMDVIKEVKPQVIIHTAAMSKPDDCLKDKKLCDAINIDGTTAVVHAAKALAHSPHLIYTSTDFVLGDDGPHDETAIPDPLNYYGHSKLKAEKVVEQSGLLNTIVRPVFMYGEIWEGVRPTFLHWVKQSIEQGKQIKIVNDQYRTPTYVGDICKGIESIVLRKAIGLYHLAGEEGMTPYQMASVLVRHLVLNSSLIDPVTADTFNEPVRRARQGGLVISKAKQELGFCPVNFIDGLKLSGFIRS